MPHLPIILASQSPARLELLKSVNVIPRQIIPANIDEAELPQELAHQAALRLAQLKAFEVEKNIDNAIIIAADSIVSTGRRILPKALNADDVRYCIELLSGRRHRVTTGLCIIRKKDSKIHVSKKIVRTIVKFKVISLSEIDYYIASREGIGKAGGYSIKGFAESFVEFMSGSYSNIVGLPLTQTLNMLKSLNY